MWINQIKTEDWNENNKTRYFSKLFASVKSVVPIHKEYLWDGKSHKDANWVNVTQHCLVEVARVEALAEKLKLPKDIIISLKKAAMLHDFFKKQEKDIVNSDKYENPNWEAFDDSIERGNQALQKYMKEWEYSINDDIIYLISSVWHTSLIETRKLLEKSENDNLTDLEIAFLLLHYVDDYTIWSDWSNDILKSWNKYLNDLDIRMENNRKHPRYRQLNEDWKKIFSRKTFDEQEEVWVKVESYIYKKLNEDNSMFLSMSKKIPRLVDDIINKKISKS